MIKWQPTIGAFESRAFSDPTILFYILRFVFIMLTNNHCSAVGNMALAEGIRTWVRSQVQTTFFIFFSFYRSSDNLSRIPTMHLNVQPQDVLLPISNAFQPKEL